LMCGALCLQIASARSIVRCIALKFESFWLDAGWPAASE
jgi:hypothetical protein